MAESTLYYVTVSGLPLTFKFQWPFHKSTSGADFHVLHGEMKLVDGTGLHTLVAVHVSQVLLEKFPTLEADHAQSVVINALRKEVETKQLEFLKASKRQPVPLSSRFTNFKTKDWQFMQPREEELGLMLRDKVYWGESAQQHHVWVADPCDALYVNRTTGQLMDAARGLQSKGLIALDGEYATATDALRALSAEIEAREKHALEELQLKHAFEQTAVKK
jgi:hypothetical protein